MLQKLVGHVWHNFQAVVVMTLGLRTRLVMMKFGERLPIWSLIFNLGASGVRTYLTVLAHLDSDI